MTMRKTLLLLLTFICLATTSGCVYRANISQGNLIKQEDLDQTAVGMTKSQVRYLLGTPMITDPFKRDRWDYVYYFKKGGSDNPIRDRLIVYFDGDKVASLDRNAPIG